MTVHRANHPPLDLGLAARWSIISTIIMADLFNGHRLADSLSARCGQSHRRGCSTAGIGRAIAEGLACAGAVVVINGRGEEQVGAALRDIRALFPATDI